MPRNYRSKDGFNLPAWYLVLGIKYRDGELNKLQIDNLLATGMLLVLDNAAGEIDAKVKSVKKLNEVRKKQNQKATN